MLTVENAIAGENAIQILLQQREGGEREVETPGGRVDLVTDEYVIEIKHISRWIEGAKVLVYAKHFPTKKPRIHLFGGYTQSTRQLVEQELSPLGIVVTWEQEPF